MKNGMLFCCDLCKSEIGKYEAAKAGWDWFTGTLTRTRHFCPDCKDSKYRHDLYERYMSHPKRRGRPPKDQP